MRTTITFADDVAAAIERVQRERSVGVSEAVNDLIRAGLVAKPARKPFRQRAYPMGARYDVTNIGELLDLVEGPAHR